MRHIHIQETFTQGIGLGSVYRVLDKKHLKLANYTVTTDEEKERELGRFDHAVDLVSKNLSSLAEEESIFGAHLLIAQDPSLRKEVEKKIQAGENAEQATRESVDSFKAVLEALTDNSYMQARAVDFEDVGGQILAAMQDKSLNKFEDLVKPSVIVATDLYPSDTAALDSALVLGILCAKGGSNSHVSIMAKNRGIPALVGIGEDLDAVENGDFVAFDAASGDIYVNPDPETRQEMEEKAESFRQRQEALLEEKGKPVRSKDGREVQVCCNIGSLAELEAALPYYPEGVGLLRTEFLFMDSDRFPTEDEQFAAYKEIAEKMNKPVTIRTLDIGGDKTLKYFKFDEEDNPFLGWRGIRMTLTMQDVFKTQIRAILRASAFGEIQIMFPMIISLEEVEEAKALVHECMNELKTEGQAFKEDIKLGVMIETPAAVFIADELAQEVDFFSIGTNDLTQYVLAVDRGNEKIKKLFNYFHPSVIRAIDHVLKAGHRQGIPVAMCGEMAGNRKATQLLLGLGLDEFSMSAPLVPEIGHRIRSYSYEEAARKAEKALALSNPAAVEDFLSEEE